MLVVDASTVFAAVADSGADGDWARAILGSEDLVAPHSMPAEAVNVLRRAVLAKRLSEDAAALASGDVTRMPVELFPFHPLSDRVWTLRSSLTVHDAWYVALAEFFEAPLATLDLRLARASGPACEFKTPPKSR